MSSDGSVIAARVRIDFVGRVCGPHAKTKSREYKSY